MRTYVLVVLGLWAAYYFVFSKAHLGPEDALAYSKKHPEAAWAQPADYYIGLYHYQRAEYGKAEAAFTQLLADYATGQYAARGLYFLEDSAESQRDWDAAKGACAQYLDQFPNGKDAEIMRKRYDFLKYQHP